MPPTFSKIVAAATLTTEATTRALSRHLTSPIKNKQAQEVWCYFEFVSACQTRLHYTYTRGDTPPPKNWSYNRSTATQETRPPPKLVLQSQYSRYAVVPAGLSYSGVSLSPQVPQDLAKTPPAWFSGWVGVVSRGRCTPVKWKENKKMAKSCQDSVVNNRVICLLVAE